ncbi:nucleoside/nucleotide kinase family protein [Nocardioides jensenii]|uniref:uridine kinase n=1 Tax=Nocardioides jensenii TaxID=1843 RepID=UPI000B113B1F|nr:uridine kinase [Nocardioides jensenii]
MNGSTDARSSVLESIAGHLDELLRGHPLRVGVDGVCGSGKSTFTRELVTLLAARDRPVVLVDSDGFHHVRAHRYRQGRDSARGYYEDGYDFGALADRVLRPLGPGGSGEYAVTVHDLATDRVIDDQIATAPPDALVLFDATFIQRDDLRDLWDVVIYLHTDEDVAIARGVARDSAALGGEGAARSAYESRYMAACRIYLEEQRPRERATIVIDNTDPRRPTVERLPLNGRQS